MMASSFSRLLLLGSLICGTCAFSTPTTKSAIRQSTALLPHQKKWQPPIPSTRLASSIIRLSPSNCPTRASRSSSSVVARQSALFGQKPQNTRDSSDPASHNKRAILITALFRRLAAWGEVLSHTISSTKPIQSIRRAVVVLMASAMIWLGTAGSYTPPASAASPAAAAIERILPSQGGDQIIDRYIQQHMFDSDDAALQDPLESAYREATADYKTDGSYPRALKEVAADVLGKSRDVSVGKRADDGGFLLNSLLSVSRFLAGRVGISEQTALTIIAGSIVLATPVTGMMVAMMIGMQSKRSMNRLMKERYGESYTVDATIKEVTDDDEEEDEDDDEDEEDDEEGDDDADDDKK